MFVVLLSWSIWTMSLTFLSRSQINPSRTRFTVVVVQQISSIWSKFYLMLHIFHCSDAISASSHKLTWHHSTALVSNRYFLQFLNYFFLVFSGLVLLSSISRLAARVFSLCLSLIPLVSTLHRADMILPNLTFIRIRGTINQQEYLSLFPIYQKFTSIHLHSTYNPIS